MNSNYQPGKALIGVPGDIFTCDWPNVVPGDQPSRHGPQPTGDPSMDGFLTSTAFPDIALANPAPAQSKTQSALDNLQALAQPRRERTA